MEKNGQEIFEKKHWLIICFEECHAKKDVIEYSNIKMQNASRLIRSI